LPGARASRRETCICETPICSALAALAEIGGAWLIWQGLHEHKGPWWIGAGIGALGAYGFVASLQADANFGRILAAYGGVFVAGLIVTAAGGPTATVRSGSARA
jgi:drug/metabolite transporter superfamily protein YnfA